MRKSPEILKRKSRNIYSFLGKTKSMLKNEKAERLKNLSKRRYDASTALTASMGQKIQRNGRKIVIGAKGITSGYK